MVSTLDEADALTKPSGADFQSFTFSRNGSVLRLRDFTFLVFRNTLHLHVYFFLPRVYSITT